MNGMDMCYAWMVMGFIWEHRELRCLMDKHWEDTHTKGVCILGGCYRTTHPDENITG
jgi:hypothetical protein